MEDYTAEMIKDMAFSFCPQCGTAIVPNHKGRPRKFCSPECRSRWNNTHPKPENWRTVRSKICPVCGREFSYRHQYGLERKYCAAVVQTGAEKRRRTGMSKKIIGVYPMFNTGGICVHVIERCGRKGAGIRKRGKPGMVRDGRTAAGRWR